MARELRCFQPLEGPAAALARAFSEAPHRWIPGAEADDAERLLVAVHAGSLTRTVRVRFGEPWHVTRTAWRSLSWEPLGGGDETSVNRLLPALDGELGVHEDTAGRATLVLDARYLPPGGLLGAAVDAVALNRLARQTGQRFLEDVGVGLSRLASQRDAPQHARPAARR